MKCRIDYKAFLRGESWDDRFLKIDYDNVTVSLSDNIVLDKMTGYFTDSNKKIDDWKPHSLHNDLPNRLRGQ